MIGVYAFAFRPFDVRVYYLRPREARVRAKNAENGWKRYYILIAELDRKTLRLGLKYGTIMTFTKTSPLQLSCDRKFIPSCPFRDSTGQKKKPGSKNSRSGAR